MLHELERMGPFPFTPIVTGNKVSTNDIKRIADVLINMHKDSSGKKLLTEFQFDGFVKKSAEFYQPIVEMLSEVTLDPGQ